MKEYTVKVNFGGFIGCDEEYEVYAIDEDDAIEQARELAMEDCIFEVVAEYDDDDLED